MTPLYLLNRGNLIMDLQAEAGRKYVEVIAGCLRVPVAPNSTVLRGKGNANRLRLVCMRLSSETFLSNGGRLPKIFTAVVPGLPPRRQPPGMLPNAFHSGGILCPKSREFMISRRLH